MSWRIVCDFDGTVTPVDVVDSILEAFAGPTWLEVEADWRDGRIGSRECLARQFDMVRATPPALHRHLDGIAIDPGFAGFVDAAGRLGMPLGIVSDGVDGAIRRILDRHGLGGVPVAANRLRHLRDDRWRVEFPNASDGCRAASGTCKCATAAGGTLPTLLIGDGRSDFCIAGEADFVFAKGALARHCAGRGIPHRRFHDFAELPPLLGPLAGARRPRRRPSHHSENPSRA